VLVFLQDSKKKQITKNACRLLFIGFVVRKSLIISYAP